MKRVRWMNDGTIGVLSQSCRYYLRHMYKGKSYTERPKKYPFKWDRIEYYTLRWKYIPLASTECKKCWDIIQSQYCWHYVTCSCWSTSVETDRWFPARHRIITNQ